MKIAVVIPIRNEREGLLELAANLLGQSLVPDEIIFVDAGSTDGGPELLERTYPDERRIRLLRAPGAFPGEGRNVAIASTAAAVIAQIDGGNLPGPCWLERLCAPLLDGSAVYAAGAIRIMPIWKVLCGVRFDIGEVYGASLFSKFQTEGAVVGGGAGVAYRREIWERVGGFPGKYRFGSDPLFARKVRRLDVKIALVPDAAIFWQIGPGFRAIVERQFRYQRAKFRQPEGITRFRGTLTLPFVAGLASTLIATGALRPIGALAALALLAALYWVRRCLKVFRVYRQRSTAKLTPAGRAGILVLIGAVEFVHLFSRVAGTVAGIGDLRHRSARLKEMRAYLDAGPAAAPVPRLSGVAEPERPGSPR